ncbi:GntR family transcriptional regulator [Streptomyces roseicoloratus]|uniref:GntR family transcriptional regulator n=1 Tax=Streptomyces roseicoloratus TaxID=2508722 RepID=UPI001009E454|nr:GntR family transcriptional regulator [Streptomyces roseicoloratus]
MAAGGPRRRPVVALYERIADAIHDGTYPPGSTLPSEPKLAGELGVSRPALREALLLLQEDGLLTVRRGVGRTVNAHPPRRGFEQIQALEELLGTGTGAGGPLRVRGLLRSVEEPTDFTTQHLLAPAGAELRFWESVLVGEAGPAVLSHEWAAPVEVLERAHPAFAEALRAAAAPERTSMLGILAGASRGVPLAGHSAVTATLLGRRRGEQLGRAADTPAVLVTQVVRVEETPVLAAKHMLPTGAPGLAVLQSN